jgi:hypothetical protein
MLWSFEALIRLSRLVAPPALVPSMPPAGVIASRWPFEVASVAGAECRLAHGRGEVDWAFCVAGDRARERLSDALAACPEPCDSAGADAGVRRFLTAWSRRGTSLHAGVPSVWLEFDHDPLARGDAIPFVTFKIDEQLAGGRDAGALRSVLAQALDLLGGDATRRASAIVELSSCLPDGARLLHIATLPHRRSTATRVILSVPTAEIGAAASRLGWDGDPAGLEAGIRGLWGDTGMLSIGVDVAERVGPRLAVECYLPTSPLEDPRWMVLLDGLVAMDACTSDKRDALCAWPSRDDETSEARRIARQLLVKLVFDPDGLREAKAYLAFIPRLEFFRNPEHISPPNATDP